MESQMTPLDILKSRHSVRTFSIEPVMPDIITKLKAEITMTNTHQQGIKFQLILDDPEPLKGFSKIYGFFENPRNYMAAVVDTASPDIFERAGYFAERFVIKAVELGLGTCFVGGTFDESKVKAQLRAGEKILFIVLFGYPLEGNRPLGNMMVKFMHRKKMDARQFFSPAENLRQAVDLFPLLDNGLEAVACAPSALNKRPTRLCLDESGAICAKVDVGNPKTLIDLGIAKFNFNFATATECEWGNGQPLICRNLAFL